jgi:hypothetical protein
MRVVGTTLLPYHFAAARHAGFEVRRLERPLKGLLRLRFVAGCQTRT